MLILSTRVVISFSFLFSFFRQCSALMSLKRYRTVKFVSLQDLPSVVALNQDVVDVSLVFGSCALSCLCKFVFVYLFVMLAK